MSNIYFRCLRVSLVRVRCGADGHDVAGLEDSSVLRDAGTGQSKHQVTGHHHTFCSGVHGVGKVGEVLSFFHAHFEIDINYRL